MIEIIVTASAATDIPSNIKLYVDFLAEQCNLFGAQEEFVGTFSWLSPDAVQANSTD